jgi:uncharacterized protein YkwD
MKRWVVLILILSFSFTWRAEAFSFFQTADTVVRRVSDIVYYLMTQKKYIFDNFVDPNTYSSWSDVNEFEKNIVAITGTTSVQDKIPTGNPIVTTPPVVPKVQTPVAAPKPAVSIPVVIAPPILVSKPTTTPSVPVILKPVPTSTPSSDILIYTNKERAEKSLNLLIGNVVLNKIAKLRLEDLFSKQYFEHESPDGQSAVDVAKQVGYEYLLIGENLALGNFGGDKGIVEAWMDSPGHRANILNAKYKELGVAERTGEFEGSTVTIAVQIFGEPATACPKPSASTKTQITSSTASLTKMQAQAKVMYDELTKMKSDPAVDKSYYNQKVQEYNYFAKNINEAVLILKSTIDSYNIQVNQYNLCIQ